MKNLQRVRFVEYMYVSIHPDSVGAIFTATNSDLPMPVVRLCSLLLYHASRGTASPCSVLPIEYCTFLPIGIGET